MTKNTDTPRAKTVASKSGGSASGATLKPKAQGVKNTSTAKKEVSRKRAKSTEPTTFKVEPLPSNTRVSVKNATTKKPRANEPSPESNSDPLENLGSLPHTYGSDTIYLVAQEPHWLFTYWDIDISRHPGGPCHLRVEGGDGAIDHEIEVPFESRNWYIPVKKAGSSYVVDIGFYRAGGWNSLARSAVVTTPRDTFSPSEDFRFATVPLHIGFHKLVETISRSMGGASELVPALSSMAMASPKGESSGAPLEARERELLEALLGGDFFSWLSSGAWSSEEIHSAVHQRLLAQSGSGELAELVGRIQLAQAESSLFSALSGIVRESAPSSWSIGAMGSEQLAAGVSSWLTAALASWAGAAQSSWASSAAAGSFAGAAQSSWASSAAAGSLAGAAQSSWASSAAAGSFAGAAQSSWASSGAGSWLGAILSSGSVPTSWAGAETAVTSWGGLASWSAGAGASWGGIGLSSLELSVLSSWSEALSSSFAESSNSSWGGSEQSSWFSAPGGVHANIIVCGHGEPGSRLRIGDQTIQVDKNGAFEHRLVLEGSRREVSIRAIPSGEALQQ